MTTQVTKEGDSATPIAVTTLTSAPLELRKPLPVTVQRGALGVAALMAVAAIIWIARPVGIGVFLGMLTAFSISPLYVKLRGKQGRSALAAAFCVFLILLAALAALAGTVFLVVERGSVLLRQHMRDLEPGGPVRHLLEQINARLPRIGIHPEHITQQIGNATTEISMRLAGMASVIAGATLSTVLMLLFLLLTSYYVLQNWTMLIRHAELMLPLDPRDTRALLDEFRRVGRSVLLGTVLTGIAQGLLAGLGYWIFRVPEPAFFGTLTAVASLLPSIGTLLVWVPAGVVLLLTGHVALGVLELLWGLLFVVGFCDYVLRPKLVDRDGGLPGLLTLIALFGGLEVFGLVGLILGPVIMSLSIALLRIYARAAARERRAVLPTLGNQGLADGPADGLADGKADPLPPSPPLDKAPLDKAPT
jgi:predicted PurR-regulated permease PerM